VAVPNLQSVAAANPEPGGKAENRLRQEPGIAGPNGRSAPGATLAYLRISAIAIEIWAMFAANLPLAGRSKNALRVFRVGVSVYSWRARDPHPKFARANSARKFRPPRKGEVKGMLDSARLLHDSDV
jgi:hypothetical protein